MGSKLVGEFLDIEVLVDKEDLVIKREIYLQK